MRMLRIIYPRAKYPVDPPIIIEKNIRFRFGNLTIFTLMRFFELQIQLVR